MLGFTDKKLLKRMCNVIKHRGPDDNGIFIDENVCLGNQRLSIIDLQMGHQPIHNEDESIWITYNGEIYNFLELKEKLEKLGHKFYTSSDTETIIHAYEQFGNSFLEKLRGMFAFAIWDSNKKKLILARDRLGIKPLYYTFIDKDLLFASEIKSLLQYSEIKREVNFHALNNYISLRYIPGPYTIFQNIYKVPPAHALICENGRIKKIKYWNLKPEFIIGKTEEYYCRELYKLLEESVRMTLRSDVPLGVFISGGLDSTTIIGIMSKFLKQPINTFSVGFGLESDELKYAKIVADNFKTNHHELIVDIDIKKILPKIIWYLDEPLSDVTNIPAYLVSQLAKKYVKVVLTGEGGDELFSGYVHEKSMLLVERYKKIFSNIVKSKLINIIKILPISFIDKFFEYTSSMGIEGKKKLLQYLKSFKDVEKSYSILISTFDDHEKKNLFSNKLSIMIGNKKIQENFKSFFKSNYSLANQILLIDSKIWLPNFMLPKLDRMTMANSIEGRVPLLDNKLLEFSFNLPPKFKLRGMTEKYILRKTMSKLLPKEIIKRRKRPFITPIHFWGEKQLMELCSIFLSKENIIREGYFNYGYIQKLLRNYKKSKLICERQLWTLINFEIWYKIFIENENFSELKL
jgi:asparagine synthase (glutamine-hydrolysing)